MLIKTCENQNFIIYKGIKKAIEKQRIKELYKGKLVGPIEDTGDKDKKGQKIYAIVVKKEID
ncbi:MAG: hypothetical protein QW051_01185 [Candidatus Aenigmatarchaeota archaeon]